MSIFQEPIFLDKCVICWEQDWEDYFEIQEFVAKEAFIFKVSTIFISSFTFDVSFINITILVNHNSIHKILQAEDIPKTRQWFKALQFYGLSLGNWRRRRNALANIMINGMARDHRNNRERDDGKRHNDQNQHFSDNPTMLTSTNNTASVYSVSGSNRTSTENLL